MREPMPIKLSILVCTHNKGDDVDIIYKKLKCQVNHHVEVLVQDDSHDISLCFRRNELVLSSSGEYIVHVNSDDMISDNYVKSIMDILYLESPDCIGITGSVINSSTVSFVNSMRYSNYNIVDNIQYGPVNHLNPIKRSIVLKYLFLNLYEKENTHLYESLLNAKLLVTESVICQPIYTYNNNFTTIGTIKSIFPSPPPPPPPPSRQHTTHHRLPSPQQRDKFIKVNPAISVKKNTPQIRPTQKPGMWVNINGRWITKK